MPHFRDVVIVASLVTIPFGTSVATYTLLKSTLVRFRANYHGLRPEHENGPVRTLTSKSYLGMMVGIYQHEGAAGLFKSIVPITLSTFVLGSAAVLDMFYFRPNADQYRWDLSNMPLVAILGYVVAWPVISLPAVVMTNRDIIRPIHPPNTNPITSFRLPLTPQERRRPWLLYSVPGLFMTQMVIAGLYAFEKNFSNRVFGEPLVAHPASMSYWRVTWPRMVLPWAIFTPFEVLSTRLAVQSTRSSSQSEKSSVDRSDGDWSHSQSGGLDTKPALPRYIGMIDCARRIIKEEGFWTLYRGWWVPV